MQQYNEDFVPPAPYCEILVSDVDNINQTGLGALIDTGADITAIPLNVARRLGLRHRGIVFVEGSTGERVPRHTFGANVSIDGVLWFALRVMAWNEDSVLLGRDVLNHYHITLDGPNLTLTISG